jgi:hypothetical protein
VSDRDPLIDAATDDWPDTAPGEQPTEPGWYAYSEGRQIMLFNLSEDGQWYTHFEHATPDCAPCAWGYIEQALTPVGVALRRIELPPPSGVLNPPEILARLVEQWGEESIRDAFEARWPQTPPTDAATAPETDRG